MWVGSPLTWLQALMPEPTFASRTAISKGRREIPVSVAEVVSLETLLDTACVAALAAIGVCGGGGAWVASSASGRGVELEF